MPAVWEPNPAGAAQAYYLGSGGSGAVITDMPDEITSSASDPEGVVTADPGKLHYNTATRTLWIKDSGTGNTGWIELQTVAP